MPSSPCRRLWAGPIGASHFAWAIALAAWWSGGAAVVLVYMGFLRSADRLGALLAVVFTQTIGGQAIGVTLVLALNTAPVTT